MLLDLLRRDLKLHWDIVVLPYVILILAMGALGIANEGAALVGLLLMGSLFVPFLPMAIHLRENNQGTLGSLVAMPIFRRSVVRLRYLEVLLMAGAMMVLAHLGTWIVSSASAHRFAHFEVIDQGGILVICVLLLFCFLFPMPITLRWNGKGLALAFATLYALGCALGGLGLLMSPSTRERFEKALFVSVMHLVEHPGLAVLGFVGLFMLSYLISTKAFSRRDF